MNKPLLIGGILLLSAFGLHAKISPPPAPSLEADFEADVIEICAGDSVHFTDLTTENPTGWAWSFSGGSPSSSSLQNPVIAFHTPGTFKVSLKANNGSETDEEVKEEYIRVQPTPSSSFNITSATAQCNGNNSFSFVNTGGSGSHFWGFSGASPINSSAVNPSGVVFTGAGIHTVQHKVTDGGCFSITVQDITIFSSPTALTVTTTASNCAGSSGTITIGAATGGTAPFTYSVNGSSFTPQTSYTAKPPGTYTVTVRDVNGCSFTRTAVVGSSGGPTSAALTITSATCSNANGIITVNSVTGGAGQYLFAVDNGALTTATTFTGIAPGQHQLKVKDQNGCQLTQNFTMTNTVPGAVATTTTPSACVGSTGTLTLGAVTGGRSPYTFSIDGSPFSSVTNYTGLAAGPHTIVVKDVTGCTFTTTVTIATTPGPGTLITSSSPSKCSPSTGTITVQTPTGGTAPYTYSFNGGAFNSAHAYIGLAAGTYTVVAKDANGCTSSQTINVSNTPAPTAIAVTTSASACSASTGALTLGTVTGGTAPYTYSVDGSAFTSTTSYNGLAGGAHTVVVKDVNACTFTTSIEIDDTQPAAAAITTTPASCGATGSLTIGAVTGGVAPFVYSVNNSAFTPTTAYNNRTAGTYTVSVKDFNGCILTQTVAITSTAPTALAVTSTSTACGASNGTVTIGTVTGGVSPFTYSVNNSALSSATTYTGLAAGIYNAVVKDANGCTFGTVITVASTGGPAGVTLTSTDGTCGVANGSITVTSVSGGTAPFIYSLDNGSFTSSTTFTGVGTGTHTVRVQDANGCIFPVNASINNASGPGNATLTSVNATCGNANGTITVSAVAGGTAPFTYSLNGGTFTGAATFTGLAAGTYTVTIRDVNGCTIAKTRTISNTSAPAAINFALRHTGCSGPTTVTGVISITGVSGGVAPYTYSFNGSAFTSTTSYNQLAAGTYTITVKDANGCTFSATQTILNVPQGPQAVSFTEVDPGCGLSNGSVTITNVTGGTAPFMYDLGFGSNFTSSNVFTGLAAGSYPLNVKDVNGCETGFGNHPVLVTPGGPSAVAATAVSSTCGQPNGSVTITSVTGGVAPYQYSLNGGAFVSSTTITGTGTGLASLTVKDANGCTFTAHIVFNNSGTAPGPPFITQNGFLLTSTASQAYQWFLNGVAVAGATSQTFLVQQNGSYTVTRTSGGCTSAPSNAIVISNLRLAAGDAPDSAAAVESNDTRHEYDQLTGRRHVDTSQVTVYPNPSDGAATLSFRASEKTVYTIEVMNVFGQVVFAEQVSGFSGTYTKQLDLSGYGAGIYTVVLSGDGERSVQKMVTH